MAYGLSELDRYLNLVLAPIFIFTSFIGNALAILVLKRKPFHSLPMSVYLTFLAVVDAGTVISGLLPRFILAATGYDVRSETEFSCQSEIFIMYLFTQLSAWTLVIVTAERVISIIRPHKVKLVCTKNHSAVALLTTTALVALTNIPIFFIFGKYSIPKRTRKYGDDSTPSSFNSTSSSRACVIKDDGGRSKSAFFTTQFLKQCLLPFVIIFVFNCIIIAGLVRRQKMMKRRSYETTLPDGSLQIRTKSGLKKVVSRRDASLSVVLVIVNAVFLACTFPIGIYQQMMANIPERGIDSPGHVITYTVLVFIFYLNNSLNLVLYYVSGSRFREELRSLFYCRRLQDI
ncbi:hypothetical protein BgiMline_027399 [Biomphalaria glabrata]|nr:thyrotropin-releasing hormone receptor [Biomphalaria glabrata]